MTAINTGTETLDRSRPIVRIAKTLDDVQTCFAIRSAAFVGRGEPMDEEFDGNDFCSSVHLLARQDGRAVGTMRIRQLSAGTATWERLAVLPAARSTSQVLKALANAALDYTEHKRFRRVIGTVSDPKLMRFWRRFGFEETGEAPLVYGGVVYTPMAQDFAWDSHDVDISATQHCEADAFAVRLQRMQPIEAI